MRPSLAAAAMALLALAPLSAANGKEAAAEVAATSRDAVVGVRPASNALTHSPAVRAFRAARLRTGQAQLATTTDIHPSLGTTFGANSDGAMAVHSVSTAIRPKNISTHLYTPTLYPSGGSCIEVTTAYTSAYQVVWAWDWCRSKSVARQVAIDATFLQTYGKSGHYTVQISRTNAATNTWTAYLYNWIRLKWDTFYIQSGVSQLQRNGWDTYEIYSDLGPGGTSYACADLARKQVQSQNIRVRIGGRWVAADATNAGHEVDSPLADFHCPTLRYKMIAAYSHWRATG